MKLIKAQTQTRAKISKHELTKGNIIKQTETCATNKSNSSYPNNSPSLFQRRGEYTSIFEDFTAKHHGHTNRSGAEMISLLIITEPLDRSKVFTVGGSQTFNHSGAYLDNTMSQPPIIHYDQVNATIDRRGHNGWEISLRSLESITEVQRGKFGWSINDSIVMNPLGTIGSN